jgi:lysophospholipase L1-like esterase
MSVEARVVQQFWVGDSHLAPNHHLPTQYGLVQAALLDETQRYRPSPELQFVRGGRRFDDGWVDRLCEAIKTPTFPRNYVICCGTNNIRDAGIMGLKKVKQQLLDWHRALINAINETERGTLLIVSPIPDNRLWTQWIGEELDTGLRELCHQAGPRVRYAPFRTTKTTFSGDFYRWRRELFSDDVHLNAEGARLLAEVIIGQQINFPSACYGFSSRGPSAARVTEARRHRGEVLDHRDLRVTHLSRSSRLHQVGRQDPRGRLPPS